MFSPEAVTKKARSSERYYQVNRLFCAALSVESVNPQRIVPGPFFVCVKRDAGDAQAVASWKKSFVRSSTGDDDATSTTVAASAAGDTLAAARRRRTTSTARARSVFEATRRRRDARVRTGGRGRRRQRA